MQSSKKGLNSFQLKIIALVIMTIDHLAVYQILTASSNTNTLMRMVGRIAAPLFLFLIVEGLRHTRSKKNYIIRLYIASIAVQAIIEITALFFNGYIMGNIFQTFFYAALYITCIEKIKKREKNVLICVILMIVPMIFVFINQSFINIIFPSPFGTEYSFLFVILATTWYFINNKIINCAIFAGLAIIGGIIDYKLIYNLPFFNLFTFHHLFISIQWIMVFAVPFMLLYNGEKGKPGLKYFFYIYYPAHQYLFFILSV